MEAAVKNDYTRAWRVHAGKTIRLMAPVTLLHDLTGDLTVEERQKLLTDYFGPLTARAILEQLPPEEM